MYSAKKNLKLIHKQARSGHQDAPISAAQGPRKQVMSKK